MDWDDFKYVQAVARSGSVRAAGELLKVHGSTVARHLDHVERQVGTRLFARTPRGMEITAAGAEVMEALDRVAAELDQVERNLKSSGPAMRGPVAVAVQLDLAAELLIPRLGDFYRHHPGIEVALRCVRDLDVLARGEADLALWVTDQPPGDLIGRPLATVMARAYGTPACLQALQQAPATGRWVGKADAVSLSGRFRAHHFSALPSTLELDHPALVARAVEAGLGIGLLPCHVGEARPGLARAGSESVQQGQLWLFTRSEARGVARIQTVSLFLQALVAGRRHRIEGTEPREDDS